MFLDIKSLFLLFKLYIIDKKIQKLNQKKDLVAESIYVSGKEIAELNIKEMSTEKLIEKYNEILEDFDLLKMVKMKDYSKDFLVITYDFVKETEKELKKRGYEKELKLASLYKEEIFK